jgi:SNF2 family DNA or RNA helicase
MKSGCIDVRTLEDPARRLAFLEQAIRDTSSITRKRPAIAADAGIRALLAEELTLAELRVRAQREATRSNPTLKTLKRQLHPYQAEGVQRFLGRGRLLLADDMGLGKTTQAIACCHALYHGKVVRRGLIVVPAALKSQWHREWLETTDVPVRVIEGNQDERRRAYRDIKEGFLIANYELILRDFELLAPWSVELTVLDEAQRIKNFSTKSSVYVKALPATRRLALTGTPMENRLDELASILDWVDDRALAPKWRLPAWHISYEGDGMKSRAGARNLDTLRTRLSDCLLRRVRTEVLSQLPKRSDTRVPVILTPEQRDEHDALNESIARYMSIAERRSLRQQEFLRLMQLLTTQRMIANGLGQLRFDELWPAIDGRLPSPALLESLFAPKLLEFRRLVESLVIEQGRKVVVFSQWRRMLKLAEWSVRDLLRPQAHRPLFFTGAESSKLRTQSIVEFHDDQKASILFLSDAGGVGLNLQKAANACINLELPWNPAVLEQRIGRIYRLGQTLPIDVYNLVSEECIESRIASTVGKKQALFKGLFDGDSNEVRFEEGGGFISEVRRLLDAQQPQAPSIEVGEGQILDEDSELETNGALEVSAENLTDSTDICQTANAAGLRGESPPADLEVTSLLGKLSISHDADGGLSIHAPPEAAQSIAELFETIAKLLRDVKGKK